MICSNCGRETTDGKGKCSFCGADLTEKHVRSDIAGMDAKRRCSECGAPLRDNVRFCTKCGAKIIENSQGEKSLNNEMHAEEPDKKKNGKRINGIRIPVIVILTVCIITAIFFMGSILPNQNEESIIADMREGTAQQESVPAAAGTKEKKSEPEIETEIGEEPAADILQTGISENESIEAQGIPVAIQLDSRYIRSIQASSELTDSTKTYRVESLLDGNKETCWSEGIDGTGEGEFIFIEFTCPVYLSEIAFLNGYMKNETVYNANGKIKRAEVSIAGEDYEAVFGDWQYQDIENNLYTDCFSFDELVQTQYLRITILEGQKGTKYDDICLTEMAFWGYVEE